MKLNLKEIIQDAAYNLARIYKVTLLPEPLLSPENFNFKSNFPYDKSECKPAQSEYFALKK